MSKILIICIIIYIIGIYIYVETILRLRTVESQDAPTPSDVRLSLIWPIIFIYNTIKIIIGLFNEVISVLLLAFNIYYKHTIIYQKIDKWSWKC